MIICVMYGKDPELMLAATPSRTTPQRALEEALPIALKRGITKMSGLGPERVFDLSLVSK
jgi:hypothetical protein